ncbi:MAG: FtsX-like permease family protein [Thermodesulfobacteriaceae bacterium]|nr:FtsX-like permease family protein [Thermodesulfobacteriaceae bacterium]
MKRILNWEIFIAFKYIFSPKRERFTGIISTVAVIGVALSVCALTVVNAVITGFKEALTEKILSLNPHLSITFYNPQFKTKILEIIQAEIPSKELFSLQESSSLQGLIIKEGQPIGIILKAVNLENFKKEKGFKKFELIIKEGFLKHEVPIIIGEKLKQKLGLKTGDELKFITIEGVFTPFGFFPKFFTFKVAGSFETGVYDYDLNLVFVDYSSFIRKFKPLNFSLEIKLKDPFKSQLYKERLLTHLGFQVSLLDWQEWNRNLFAALQMEKIGLFIVLTLMVMVSLFTILAAMIMLVNEKKIDIAILRALGANFKSILKIFFFCGFILSFIGVILGLLLGISLCIFLSHYPIIKLPTEVYPVEYMPVKLQVLDLLLVSLVAIIISVLACLYPAKKATQIIPAEILRHG